MASVGSGAKQSRAPFTALMRQALPSFVALSQRLALRSITAVTVTPPSRLTLASRSPFWLKVQPMENERTQSDLEDLLAPAMGQMIGKQIGISIGDATQCGLAILGPDRGRPKPKSAEIAAPARRPRIPSR